MVPNRLYYTVAAATVRGFYDILLLAVVSSSSIIFNFFNVNAKGNCLKSALPLHVMVQLLCLNFLTRCYPSFS